MSTNEVFAFDPISDVAARFGDCVVTMGVFDGLHVGHRALIADASSYADELGIPLVAVTFERDPDELFSDALLCKLLANDVRIEMLAQIANAPVAVLPASQEVFALDPAAFLDALGSLCTPKAIFVGENFRFGSQAKGTIDDIADWCLLHDCACRPHALVEVDGSPVCATRIRKLLADGHVGKAAELLAGRFHSVSGQVVHGRGAGSGLGFPTANIEPDDADICLVAYGVYAGYLCLEDGEYPAAVNVGAPLTFPDAHTCIEAHILGFSGDLYGQNVCVSFVEHLREPRRFESVEALVHTVQENIAWVGEHLGTRAQTEATATRAQADAQDTHAGGEPWDA